MLAVYGSNLSIQPVNGSRGGSSTLETVRCSVLCLSNYHVFVLQVLAVYGNNPSIQPVNGSRGGSSTLTGNNQSAWPSTGVTQQSA